MFEISLRPFEPPVTAVIVTQPVMSVPELVMNCFAPLITHSPSSSRAVVRDVAGVRAGLGLGQPEGGQPLPRGTARGSQSRFCSSVPQR